MLSVAEAEFFLRISLIATFFSVAVHVPSPPLVRKVQLEAGESFPSSLDSALTLLCILSFAEVVRARQTSTCADLVSLSGDDGDDSVAKNRRGCVCVCLCERVCCAI